MKGRTNSSNLFQNGSSQENEPQKPSDGKAVEPGVAQHDRQWKRMGTMSSLNDSDPPDAIKGRSGWVYHSASFGCLHVSNPIRKAAILLVEQNFFEAGIALTIFANVIVMAWNSPLDPPGTSKAAIIASCEWFFLAIFTFEMVTKWIAYGVVGHQRSYLRDPWCLLDFFVVCCAWAPKIFGVGNYTGLRVLRALRPLRTLRFVPGMRVLIRSIFDAIPGLSSVAGLCALIFLVFGIVGEQLFEGALRYRCADVNEHGGARRRLKGGSSGRGEEEVIFCWPDAPAGDVRSCPEGLSCTHFSDNPDGHAVNFDTVLDACMAIVQVITFDTWSDVMYDLMGAVSPFVWIYFLLVALLGGFFVVNLFLAVVFDEFMRSRSVESVRQELDDNAAALATKLQAIRRGQLTRKKLRKKLNSYRSLIQAGFASDMFAARGTTGPQPEAWLEADATRGNTKCGATLRALVESSQFAGITMILIAGNTFVLCLPYAGQPQEYSELLETLSSAFAVAFMVELALRWLAVGWREFVADAWNIFDIVVVGSSVIDLLKSAIVGSGDNSSVAGLRALRLMRILRMARMMRFWPGLRRIFVTLLGAASQVANIFILLFIFMTMFALLGMQLFGGLCNAEVSRWHFDYYFPAMLTVLSVFSGGWVDPYVACSAAGLTWTRIFFLTALVVGYFVIFNLFIAILLDSFSEENKESETDKDNGDDNVWNRRRQGTVTTDDDGQVDGDGEKVVEVPTWPADQGKLPHKAEREESQHHHRGRIRSVAYLVISSPYFEPSLLAAIVASSAVVALDTPRLDPSSLLKANLNALNLFFVAVFTLEVIFKSIAQTLCARPDGYLRSPWNVFDFFIVLISLASLLPAASQLAAFRLLRVLRPLRLLSRIKGMKVIFAFLGRVASDAIDVIGVVLFCQIGFAVLGMDLFADAFGSCTDPDIVQRTECVPTSGRNASADGVVAPQWLNPTFGSFDDFGAAMLALYVSATGDGWENMMFVGMDSVGPGLAPQRNDFSARSMFFIAWLLLGTFTVINLFVGTVVSNFVKIKAEMDGSALLTKEQQQWQRTMTEASELKKKPPAKPPSPPTLCCLRVLFELVTSQVFENFMTLVVIANVLTMTFEYHHMDEHPLQFKAYNRVMSAFNDVYYAECVLKLLSFGVVGYFSSGWNRFDFALVALTLLDELGLLATLLPVSPNVLRILRIAPRIMRLIKTNRGLRDLLWTLALSVPALGNVGLLLGLVTFIYAVLGVHLFTYVMPGEELKGQRSFATFGSSYLVLIQCLTGDGWSDMMYDAMVDQEHGCDPDAVPSDCGSAAAIPYFISYTIVGAFILLNLVVAIILENFTALSDINPDLVSAQDIGDFGEKWANLHEEGMLTITKPQLANLLLEVAPPLGLKGGSLEEANALINELVFEPDGMAEMNGGGSYTFEEVIDALTHRRYRTRNVEMTPAITKQMSRRGLIRVGAEAPDALPLTVLDRLRSRYGCSDQGEQDLYDSPVDSHGNGVSELL